MIESTTAIPWRTIEPGSKDDASACIDRIDRLYQAKSAGRDRLCDTEA